MHGLIFVTWERFLSERFSHRLLQAYRGLLEETAASAPLASRVYDDALLLTGVGVASSLSGLPAGILLREYGRYFILNGLTRNRCAYLLTQIRSGKELLLTMSNAHRQLSCTPEGLTPPLFGYEAVPEDREGMVLIYQSPRKVCSLLEGAIEGAAALYEEHVSIIEHTCMLKGALTCRFQVRFSASPESSGEHSVSREQRVRQLAQRRLADQVLALLPEQEGVTLQDLQALLRSQQASPQQVRPSVLLQAIQHLQHVGLAASTANRAGDNLTHRRYWRVPAVEVSEGLGDSERYPGQTLMASLAAEQTTGTH